MTSEATEKRLVDALLWLCNIPSPIGEERALADAMMVRLGQTKLASAPRRYGDSIFVPVKRGTGGPRITLAGHLDVVRTSHDGPVRIEGDKLYGPGAADMKSGLAVMLDLIEHDQDEIGDVDLSLIFYAREEGPYIENELGLVLAQEPEALQADLVICLEPSDNKLSLGACGAIHAKLTFEGKTAHSARPWQGENAIHKAGPFLTELGQLAPEDNIIDGLLYRTVSSITLAQGGRGRNIIPDAFTLNLNHRFAPNRTLAQAQANIEALVAGRAQIEWVDLSPPAPPYAQNPLVVALKSAGVPAVEAKQAWTDVARFAQANIPAVNWGPGENAQAHQRNEWTSIAKLVTGQSILRTFLRSIGKR